MRRLQIYLVLLVMSVFLGTEILAVATPAAQLTLYRLLALGVVPLVVFQLSRPNQKLMIQPNSTATLALKCYSLWWLIALSSVMWAANLSAWVQSMFLMTLGVSSIIGLYFWVQSGQQWHRLIQAIWLMMSGLVIWGYVEITTNLYLFADVDKLDKYRTFTIQPMTRIPITTFENQNDYATLLLAYIVVCVIMYYLTASNWQRILYSIAFIAGSYLIFRSGSRMSLLCLLIFIAVQLLQNIRIDLRRRHYWFGLLIIAAGITAVILLRPSLVSKVTDLFYFGERRELSGDTVRMNLWRNGGLFLGQTFGFGVGAGNIEHWMAESAFWTTNTLTNMHNWWLEILVGYGAVSFGLYLMAYISLMVKLVRLKCTLVGRYAYVSFTLFNFMLIYILASITSANNMLIEWHWVFFGLIISFVKIQEKAIVKPKRVKHAGVSIWQTQLLKEKV